MKEVKNTVLPLAGDSLVIKRVLTGFDKRGNKVIRTVPEAFSSVNVAYVGGEVRSKEGDIFTVQLKHAATKGKKAQWVTVE